jgi:hypothetical protein
MVLLSGPILANASKGPEYIFFALVRRMKTAFYVKHLSVASAARGASVMQSKFAGLIAGGALLSPQPDQKYLIGFRRDRREQAV